MARLSIKDIAQQAGVSPATVSRYLNNRPGQMTEETKKRIAEVIERTGYRPHSAARNLRTLQSHLLGVIFADASNPYSSAMLEALSLQAGEYGYTLMTAFSSGVATREADSIERLLNAGVDGLIINACESDGAAIKNAAKRVPCVLLDRPVPGVSADLVTSDNEQLTNLLTQEVVDTGASSMYLLTQQDDDSAVRRIRCSAFNTLLHKQNKQGCIIQLSNDRHEAITQIDQCILNASGGSLGLICVNGLVFLKLIDALTDIGPKLPQGLHIATFDDYPWNHILFGGITTAAQDTDAIAQAVVKKLNERIKDFDSLEQGSYITNPEQIVLPGRIIRRASTSLSD